jgi:hypothetical protein
MCHPAIADDDNAEEAANSRWRIVTIHKSDSHVIMKMHNLEAPELPPSVTHVGYLPKIVATLKDKRGRLDEGCCSWSYLYTMIHEWARMEPMGDG